MVELLEEGSPSLSVRLIMNGKTNVFYHFSAIYLPWFDQLTNCLLRI